MIAFVAGEVYGPKKEFRNRTIFTTGADGFINSHSTEEMVGFGADVRVFIRATSRDESKL